MTGAEQTPHGKKHRSLDRREQGQSSPTCNPACRRKKRDSQDFLRLIFLPLALFPIQAHKRIGSLDLILSDHP
jgi:hypothetical protein